MQQDEPSPNPQYDFILNNGEPDSSKGFSFPSLPKPFLFGVIAFAVIILLIVAITLLGGRSSKLQPIVTTVSHGQEIIRVSKLVQSQTKDQDTLNLIATTVATLSSDKQQMAAYLNDNKVKLSDQDLAADTNSKTDDEIKQAAQNGTLESTYNKYLKANLDQYMAELNTSDAVAGPNGHKILVKAYQSTQYLLMAPQLKTAING